MIKIKTNLKEFESIIKLIEKISYETDYHFTEKGIKVRAVDASATYLAIFNISPNMFDEYNIKENSILTLDNEKFAKLIKKVGKTELNINILPDAIQLSNKKDKYNLKYFVGKNDDRPDPNPKCTSIWKMSSTEFTKILNEISNLSIICSLVGNEDNLFIRMKSNMIEGKTKTNAKKIQSEDCYCYYDLQYLSSVLEIKNIFKEIRLGFGTETPCVIKGTNDYLNFVFILAARIE